MPISTEGYYTGDVVDEWGVEEGGKVTIYQRYSDGSVQPVRVEDPWTNQGYGNRNEWLDALNPPSQPSQPSQASQLSGPSYMPSQDDSYPFQMDDGSFGFWYGGQFRGPYPDQNSAERAYNTYYGMPNAGVQVKPTTTKPATTPQRPGAPQFPGVNVDPALEYKKWAAQHALDVAREVFNVTRGDIDQARTAATGVLSFYNDFAGQFGYSPNLDLNTLYTALHGPTTDWQQVLGNWGLDVGGQSAFSNAVSGASGNADTRSRSVDEARGELQAAGASPADLANTQLSGRAVI